MRRAIAVALFELKRIFQKPQSYLLMFGMPVLFTFLFGGLFTGGSEARPNIIVVDNDHTNLSDALIGELKNQNIMKVSMENSAQAMELFKDQKVTGYIRIEAGLEEKLMANETPGITFVHSPSFTGASMIEELINESMLKLMVGTTASSTYSERTGNDRQVVQEDIISKLASSESAIETVDVTKSKELESMDNITARSAGFTIMFVMITMLLSTGVILEARQTGVWYRLMSTPTSRMELLLGYLLSFFLIGWIQFGILMLISRFAFGVYWGDLLANIILVSSILLCTIGLGLFVAGLVKTTDQQAVFGNLIIVSTCMLGGVYWPLEVVPDIMKQIAKFVPQYWGLEGFAELAVRGGTLIDVIVPVGILLAFTAVFLVVGMTRIRFE
ncbi:ABC transporter permease [Aquibacillus kalidii]|uniref:ABC transporter permease n=1 Tax=Aquibacillus kalidii TaxID=2762597 RepID=UPI0016486F14|nr:ABC transporter permease [Aquibacillus kalidii]